MEKKFESEKQNIRDEYKENYLEKEKNFKKQIKVWITYNLITLQSLEIQVCKIELAYQNLKESKRPHPNMNAFLGDTKANMASEDFLDSDKHNYSARITTSPKNDNNIKAMASNSYMLSNFSNFASGKDFKNFNEFNINK